MVITREMLVKLLSEKSNYYQKDVRTLLQVLDEVVLECFEDATEDEEVALQVITGVKIGCKILPKRDRVHPLTQQPIVCEPSTKVYAKFSDNFKHTVQSRYEERKDG